MKHCPFCAEEIQDAAIVCKHCGRDLPAAQAPTVIAAQRPPLTPTASEQSSLKKPARRRGLGFVLALIGGIIAVGIVLVIVMGIAISNMPPPSTTERTAGSPPSGSTAAPSPSESNAARSSSGSATSLPAVPSTQPAPESNLTAAQRNAARSAQSYLAISGFSRQGLIGQLSSEYGEKFSVGDATAAVDSLSIDWNTQAARSAAAYLKISGFSCQGLIEQLSSEHGNKYTVEQATYGAKQAGAC